MSTGWCLKSSPHKDYIERGGDILARPPKEGLLYFPFDVDFYEDFKIEDLSNEFGPLGESVYKRILCLVYRDKGYYLEIDMDRLAVKLIKSIGNRWARSKEQVIQVILYCADIGLFDKDLLLRGVITSVGIQRRFLEVKGRRPCINDAYWFLGKKPYINSPKTPINSEKPIVISEKPPVLPPDNTQRKEKKKKEKKSKENKNNKGKKTEVVVDNPDLDFADVFKTWEKAAALHPTQMVIEELGLLMDEYGKDNLCDAIRTAADQGKVTLAYVKGILRNNAAGTTKKSKADIEQEEAEETLRKLREEDRRDAERGNVSAATQGG